MRSIVCAFLAVCACTAADITFGTVTVANGKPVPLVWQERGTAHWHVMKDGTLTGQRDLVEAGPRRNWFPSQREFRSWLDQQAWVYTKDEYAGFDLEFEYWLRFGGNSGIAVWDPTRGEAGLSIPPDYTKTPSKVAYEIQLLNQFPDPKPSGSIYNVQQAPEGVQVNDDWNTMKIEARPAKLRIFINGKLVAEHDTLPERPKRGPLGLQLHDQFSVTMFRNLRLTAR
jgi:hypothetical protein